MAYELDGYYYETSATSPFGEDMLTTVAKLNAFKVVVSVLSSFYLLEFQPILRRVVEGFDAADLVKALDQKWRLGCCAGRNVMNFITSALDGVVDPRVIGPVLDAVHIGAHVESTDVGALSDTKPEELARLVVLAARVFDPMRAVIRTSNANGLVLVVAPAIELLLHAPDNQKRKVGVAFGSLYIDILEKRVSQTLLPRELVSKAQEVIERVKPQVTKVMNE